MIERYNKGISYTNQILSILKEISFGHYNFNQAMLLRNAILINCKLCSIELVLGLTSSQILKLEQCDHYFLRKLFNAPISTRTESLYIETGAMPIRCVILNKPDSKLAKQVYDIQKHQPVKND